MGEVGGGGHFRKKFQSDINGDLNQLGRGRNGEGRRNLASDINLIPYYWGPQPQQAGQGGGEGLQGQITYAQSDITGGLNDLSLWATIPVVQGPTIS